MNELDLPDALYLEGLWNNDSCKTAFEPPVSDYKLDGLNLKR